MSYGNVPTICPLLYAKGFGVAQDYAKAREWFEKAADKDSADAMHDLGWLYQHGHGVAEDYVKAREWFEKAADKGDAYAMFNLGLLYHKGFSVAQDYAKAREWFEKAAAKGNEAAPIVAALFAREFTKALALADRARSLSPDELMFESYRAHALMFLERGEEAKALYLAHKGEPVSGLDGKPWERVIVGAFSDLREAGLTHPMMAEIEKELGVSP